MSSAWSAAGRYHALKQNRKSLKEITCGAGARVTFDPVAGPFLEKLAEAAAVGGIVFEYGLLSMPPTLFPLFTALPKGLSIRGYSLMEVTCNPEKLRAAKKYIYDRLADGRFHPKIARIFSFDRTVEAYRYLESNAQVGKVCDHFSLIQADA